MVETIAQREDLSDARPKLPSDRWSEAEAEINRLFPGRSIRRVLMIAPPDADGSLFNYATAKRGRYWNFPPYGAGVIASHLRRESLRVGILNLNHLVLKACRESRNQEEFDFDAVWKRFLEERMRSFRPDLIGITCMFTQTHRSTVNVCNEVRRLDPKIPIAVGGVHVTNSLVNDKTSVNLEKDLANADLFFIYESELAFKQFIRIVNRDTPIQSLAQLFFNSTERKLEFTNRVTPQPQDLDTIPAHDLMDPTELSTCGTIGSFFCLCEKGTRLSTILSNRGCRAQCTFCSVRNFNGMGVRIRSIQSVIDELKMLRDEFGIGHVMWLDDDFLYNHPRSLALFNEMVRQRVGVTWDCTNGVIAASCTDELMAAAAESGCLGLTVGMESGNPQILREIRKPGTVTTFLKAADVLKKYEQINARVFLMIGFPHETYRMILDTIKVAQEMDLDWYNVTILQPLPNTPIFESMIHEGLLSEIDFQEVRYNSGPYGKHRKAAEGGRDLLSSDFKNAFRKENLDSVPPKEALDTIWAYMNFHLNFKRLFHEDRPRKLEQQLRYVGNIRDLVSPENAFAMYFYGYLQKKIDGAIEPSSIQMLEDRLQSCPYWEERFDEFGLSVDHLKTGRFPGEEDLLQIRS